MEKSLNKFEMLEENLKIIMNNINEAAIKSNRNPKDIILLAATKTVSVDVVNHAISLGVNYIGENRVQELLSKYDNLNLKNCNTHFIGHLQSNKVKQIVGKVNMIESVDSIKLANEISRVSILNNIESEVLVEVNIGRETNKFGVMPEDLEEFIYEISKIKGIKTRGIMAIPPIYGKNCNSRSFFSQIYKIFIDIQHKKVDNINMRYLSMGMSDDYVDAILEGANIIRIGSALFGKRNYN